MLFEKSSDTKILESVLAEVEVGQTITYEDLSKSIGRDVREFASASLRTARRFLEREKQFVFGVERGVGLIRLNDGEIVKTTESDRKRLARMSGRTLRKLACVNFESLSDDEKRQHTVAAAQFGAIAMFSKKSSTRKIESKVNGTKVIPIGETIGMFT